MSCEESRGEMILSRYFDENTYLVAGMCWKCYRDCSDLKIVGVNQSFLEQTKVGHRNRNFAQNNGGFFILDDDFVRSDSKEEVVDNCEEDQMKITDISNDKNDNFSVESSLQVLNEPDLRVSDAKIMHYADFPAVLDESESENYHNNSAINIGITSEAINEDFSKCFNKKESVSTFATANEDFLYNKLCEDELSRLIGHNKSGFRVNDESKNSRINFLGFDLTDITDSNTIIKKIDLSIEKLEEVIPNTPKIHGASLNDRSVCCKTDNTDIANLYREKYDLSGCQFVKENASSSRDCDDGEYSFSSEFKTEFCSQNENASENIVAYSDFAKDYCSYRQFEDVPANQEDFKSENIQESEAISNKMNYFIEEIDGDKPKVTKYRDKFPNERYKCRGITFSHLNRNGNYKTNYTMKEESEVLGHSINLATRSEFFRNEQKIKCENGSLAVDNPNFQNQNTKHQKMKTSNNSDDGVNEQPIIIKQEFEPINNNNFLMEPIWQPPKSPHNLIEEDLAHNPWALLVATIFLNKTAAKHAKPQLENFLNDYPNPWEVLKSEISDLEKYFVRIGLKKRSVQIWRMSRDFLYKNWRDVDELYGVGKYGRDAFNMFCLGNFDVEPKDRYLKIYKAWYQRIYLKKSKDNVDFDQKFVSAVGYKNEEWCQSDEEIEKDDDEC